MNNPSTSDYYDSVEKNTTTRTPTDINENKMELDDADDNNNNNNNNNIDDNINLINKSNYTSCDNVTSPGSSVDILDLNSGPLNPNNVTSVVTDQSNTDTASIASNDNYEEIGPIIKPKHQQHQQQQQQQQQRYHLHHNNPEQRLQSRQQHYSAQQQQQPSFSQQMYSTIPPTGYSLNHPYNHQHHPQHHNRSNNHHNYQQQQPQHHSQYNISQNYSDMNNPSMDSSTLLQQQQQQQQQQQNESSQQQYFKQEPIFRPPPTSAYYQNYYAPPPKPPNFDYAAMYGHHPPNIPHPTPSQMFWYSQHHRHNHQSGFVPSTLPPGHHHSTGHHSHPHHHLHPQHSQYLSPNATATSVNSHFGGHQQQHEQMMNVLQFSNSNGREARNRAEKQRRDKLNGSIADLATMVPHVAESPRRVDKTAVLRYSAHGLRLRYVFGKILESSSSTPESGTGLLLTDSLTKLLDAFLLTMTCRGQIVLITPSVEQHLGHCQTDLFGQNILHITHPDDHAMLKKQLIPTDLEQLLDIQDDENGDPRPRTQEEEKEIDRKLLADKRNFTVRLARATPRSEPTSYELVKIDGCFRRADAAPRGVKASTFPTGIPMIRRARGRDDSVPLHSISANDIVLVAMARIIKPPKVIERLREANYMEYRTRHLIDGRMIMVDQRISLVAGYMTDEVTGLSPFTFMHQDDVRWVIVALRQMYDSNSSYGESCYRLLTRTGNFIYLRTRGYLEIDKSTNQVRSFLCINSLVSEEEGRQRCQDMKNKFSIIINAHVPSSNTDALAVDNPQQIEKAVIYLIENLQRTAREVVEVDNDDEYCIENKSSDRNTASSSRSILDSDGNNSTKVNSERITKSPPLTLIPPNATSIKHSISKSVTIVNTTAAKNFRNSRVRNKSISENSNIRDDTSSIDDDNNSSNSNNNSIFYDDNYTEVKQEDHKNENSSFSYNNINSNCNNKDKNNGNSNNNNNDKRENDSNILIKTENIEYISDNENANDNNNRVPPLPTSDDYYDMEILNTPNDNSTSYCGTNSFMMLSSTEFKMTSSSSASSYKCENELIRDIEQKHPDLKRIRNTYEDITSDSCDSPSKKRLALSNSPLGLENISTSSLDNDQIFVNTTQTLQKTSNPQEELTQLLPSSFSQIKNSLSHIKTAATELKRQCIAYADSKNQLEQIIDERDKQEELLENIQNEYEAHLLQHHQGFTASPITGGSDGSISLPLPNVLTSTSNVKNTSSSTNVIDFETDDILQRNIDIKNATR